MSALRLGRLWRDDSFQTAVMIFFIVSVVFGFWYGSRLFLDTQYPMLAVASGSMSLPKGVVDDGWSRPFGPTLHTGDLIVVEGVNPQDVYAAPYNASGRSGDILVFRAIGSDDLIVHRAIGKNVGSDGQVVAFITQGDGNDQTGPYSPTPVENVIGKVVMRIPWIGHVALFMRNSTGILVILVLIMVLIVVEFALPAVIGKKPADEKGKRIEKAPELEGPT
ncbi:MAG: signal peptidase I [Candidatus Bathyarchaeia archaeon]